MLGKNYAKKKDHDNKFSITEFTDCGGKEVYCCLISQIQPSLGFKVLFGG